MTRPKSKEGRLLIKAMKVVIEQIRSKGMSKIYRLLVM